MNKRDHALIIGAGAAGCMAAKVLSQHFTKVTLIEKDSGPSTADETRRGIPQAHHVHNVLLQGNRLLARLYPSLFNGDFDKAGSPLFEVIREQHRLGPYGWDPNYETGWYVRAHSRRLLDRTLIKHTQAISNVEIRFGEVVQDLVYEDGRVQGVRVARKSDDGALALETVTADLVLETSGRATQVERWLQTLNAGPCEVRRVISPDAYSSRRFKYFGPALPFKQFHISRKAGIRERGVFLLAIEDGCWIVTLIGGPDDCPPLDNKGFADFAGSLDTDHVTRFLENATPDGKIHAYRKMENVCRFLDRVRDWPEGFAVIGDALCAFNPVRGQGITTAAVSAHLLQEAVETGLKTGWERRLHRQIVRVLSAPWLFSVNEDLTAFSSSWWGEKVFLVLRHKFRTRLLLTLQRAAAANPSVHLRLFEVQNLIKPVSALYDPLLVIRALITIATGRKPQARPGSYAMSNIGQKAA